MMHISPPPLMDRNLGACFDARQHGDKVALIDIADWERPVELTYRALDAACDAVARSLLARGFRRGDRIGILSLNRWQYVAAFLGTMRAGLVCVPISIKLAPDMIRYIVDDAQLKAVFHDAARAELCPAGLVRISFDDPSDFSALDGTAPFSPFAPEPDEVALMLYTSGSTGKPKGVLLSHRSQLWGLDTATRLFGDMSMHRYVVAAPMFHMNATFSLKMALVSGGSFVLMPAFDARTYARAIPRFGITWLTSVPTMLALVARERDLIGDLDFSSVQRITMGSAPLTGALIEKVQAIFPGAAIVNSYGTTEAGPMPFGPHPQGRPRPPLSLGYPAPGSDIELREGPSADEGVLYMRNPSLMNGYHNLPEKTADALRGGWYRSGDIMRRDEDGFFYFLGRADDMFVVGGENVWPGEVEKLIERMPEVHQSLVVPVPDDIKGALPVAFVVVRPGATLSEDDVKRFTLANGPPFSHPRHVLVAPEIPLASTNKPDRNLLTRRARELLADKLAQRSR